MAEVAEMMHCARCGKEILVAEALYRGYPARGNLALQGHDWKTFAHCEACDYEDYKNSYGGM